jgi:hypothetical protein
MRRIAYLCGLILGSGVLAYLFGSALIYLFTGKLSSIRMSEDGRPRLVLVDVDTLYEMPSIVPGAPDRWAGGGA